MTMDPQEQREDCRREVRRFLAERSQLAFRDNTIHQKLKIEHGFTLDDVRDALVYLVSDKQVEPEPSELGATLFYKITSSGTRAHERSR